MKYIKVRGFINNDSLKEYHYKDGKKILAKLVMYAVDVYPAKHLLTIDGYLFEYFDAKDAMTHATSYLQSLFLDNIEIVQ